MNSSTTRYARALADVAIAHKADGAAVVRELDSMAEILKSSPDLRAVWETPSVPATQKLALLDAIVRKAGISPEVRNFLAVLMDHRLVNSLPVIARQFKQEMNDRMGVAEAEIISSRELTPQEKQPLERKIAETTGKVIQPRYSVDPKILGGVVVKIGSTIYDGSVRGELQRLKHELAAR